MDNQLTVEVWLYLGISQLYKGWKNMFHKLMQLLCIFSCALYLRGSEFDRAAGLVIFFPLISNVTSPLWGQISVDRDGVSIAMCRRENKETDLVREFLSPSLNESVSLSESTLFFLLEFDFPGNPPPLCSMVICAISSGWVVNKAAT